MKTKSKKFIFALLSMAAFGMTSAALQAQDAPDPEPVQQRQRLQWSKDVEKPQLSPELQEAVKQFREQKQAMLEEFRAKYAPDREAIREMMLKCQNEDLTEEEKAALMAQIQEMKEAHQADVRSLRMQLREEMRTLRAQIRADREGGDG